MYSVEDSPLVAQLERRNRVHPYHSAEHLNRYRHWIITLHDDTLEVVGTIARVIGERELPPSRAVILSYP